jgi:beta-phosphoglucomutase-like phosphatase (HAD superfamily)
VLRAVVFDFDGVIANSEPLHYRGFRDILGHAGIELSERDYYQHYLGFDDAGVFRAVATDRGIRWTDERIVELVTAKASVLERLEESSTILFPGAEAAVRRTGASVPLAIASGALGAEIRRILDRASLTACFSAIVAAEDTAASKPAPDPYLRAVELLATTLRAPLSPAECVAIEDSPWGLRSARAAGLHTVAVAHTYELAALDADLVIASLDELDIAAIRRLWGV